MAIRGSAKAHYLRWLNFPIPSKAAAVRTSGHTSLAKRLCQVSRYADRIEPLLDLIPEVMERNEQLRPLWTAWRQNATPDLTPRRYFSRREIKVLCDFLEYLYFASDAFARSARTSR